MQYGVVFPQTEFGNDIDTAGINPLPMQRPIPIWFGGAAEPVLKHAARLDAGFTSPQEHIDAIRSFRDILD